MPKYKGPSLLQRLRKWGTMSLVPLSAVAIPFVATPTASNSNASNPVLIQEHQLGIRQIDVNSITEEKPYGFVHHGTTYMPIWYVMQALKGLGVESTWTNGIWNLNTSTPIANSSFIAENQSGQVHIEINGKLLQRVTGLVATDPDSGSPTCYIPIWYMMQVLRTIGIQSSWNGQTWNLSALSDTRPNSNAFTVFGWVTGPTSAANAEANLSNLTEIGVDDYTLTSAGGVVGTAPVGVVSNAATHQVSAYATVTNLDSSGNFSSTEVSDILENPALSASAASALTNLADTENYAGINVDFEQIPETDGTAFDEFLQVLSQDLKASGKQLNVTVPAETDNPSGTAYGAYQYSQIAAFANTVSLLTYDYTYINNPPGPIAPLWWDQQVVRYAVSQMPASKVLLGIGTYGYEWTSGGGNAIALTLPQVTATLSAHGVTPSWDAAASVPYATYQTSAGSTATIYYENQQSISEKLSLVSQYHLGGIAIWSMSLENNALWNAITAAHF
ncbi:MAG: glycosyl hydrolase family 18 protein [Alicyclobacillaceae bacterium]|nr:glycosyl hydrolase family 18 protein [Alicyclobacillaceae bacterium]